MSPDPSASHFIEYEDVFGSGKQMPKEIEGLLSKHDKERIAQYFGAKRCSKSHIQKYFSAAVAGANEIDLDPEGIGNFEKLVSEIQKRLDCPT